jgi:2,4-dienoyl-CoA reductase-like NADH-dependent reductase (Old Yellow Enzyme family)
VDGGLSVDESIAVCHKLIDAGVDAIELSGGSRLSGELGPIRMGPFSEETEAYFQNECRAFRRRLDAPLILVGGIRSLGVAAMLLDEGVTDYVSMSRPFIAEPDLINRWEAGDHRPALCVSGNFCSLGPRPHPGLHCSVEPCARVAAKAAAARSADGHRGER